MGIFREGQIGIEEPGLGWSLNENLLPGACFVGGFRGTPKPEAVVKRNRAKMEDLYGDMPPYDLEGLTAQQLSDYLIKYQDDLSEDYRNIIQSELESKLR